MSKRRRDRNSQEPQNIQVDPEIVEELRRERETPSDPEVPDLPELSIRDKGKLVIVRRGKKGGTGK